MEMRATMPAPAASGDAAGREHSLHASAPRTNAAGRTRRRPGRCIATPAIVARGETCENRKIMDKLLPPEFDEAVQQLFDETIEAVGLAKQCRALDDLWATMAVALLKLDLASNFVEQHHPGFIKEVNAAKQRVISALTTKH